MQLAFSKPCRILRALQERNAVAQRHGSADPARRTGAHVRHPKHCPHGSTAGQSKLEGFNAKIWVHNGYYSQLNKENSNGHSRSQAESHAREFSDSRQKTEARSGLSDVTAGSWGHNGYDELQKEGATRRNRRGGNRGREQRGERVGGPAQGSNVSHDPNGHGKSRGGQGKHRAQ